MILNPGEITLYSCKPQQAVFMGIIYSAITLFLFHILMTQSEPDWIRIVYIIISTGLAMHFLTAKFILTTQRCGMHSVFIKSEIQRNTLTEPAFLQFPPNYLSIQKLNQLIRVYKAENHIQFWQKRALLRFSGHTEAPAGFLQQLRSPPLTLLSMSQFSAKQAQDVLQNLKFHWQLNPETFRENPAPEDLTQLEKNRHEQDIGRSPLLILVVSLLIGLASLLVSSMVLEGLHFAVEAWSLILPFIIFSIFISWLIIRAEGKKYPFISGVLCGALLGACLYFGALQLNRIYSEHDAMSITTQMHLNSTDQHSQLWTLEPELAKTTGLTDIYIRKDWPWYRSDLKAGQQYTVQIKKGYFRDYFIDQDSFRQIPVQ